MIGGYSLRRLTEHERRHGSVDRYCLRGLTHWTPPYSFAAFAAEKRRVAGLLDEAAEALAALATNEGTADGG